MRKWGQQVSPQGHTCLLVTLPRCRAAGPLKVTLPRVVGFDFSTGKNPQAGHVFQCLAAFEQQHLNTLSRESYQDYRCRGLGIGLLI